jgi:hypothetical protein
MRKKKNIEEGGRRRKDEGSSRFLCCLLIDGLFFFRTYTYFFFGFSVEMRRSLSLACSSPRVYLLVGKFSAIKAASPDGRSSQAFLLISKAKANYPTCNW